MMLNPKGAGCSSQALLAKAMNDLFAKCGSPGTLLTITRMRPTLLAEAQEGPT
jgi:hypothetical protein